MSDPRRINKSELDAIGRALRAKVRAAKATIIALGPKLKAEFEVQLGITYPLRRMDSPLVGLFQEELARPLYQQKVSRHQVFWHDFQ